MEKIVINNFIILDTVLECTALNDTHPLNNFCIFRVPAEENATMVGQVQCGYRKSKR